MWTINKITAIHVGIRDARNCGFPDFCSRVAEDSVLLGYNFVAWGNVILIFQKNTQPSSSTVSKSWHDPWRWRKYVPLKCQDPVSHEASSYPTWNCHRYTYSRQVSTISLYHWQFNMYSVEIRDGSEHLKYLCIMYYITVVLFICGRLPGGMWRNLRLFFFKN
jgi:hypothetical protein